MLSDRKPRRTAYCASAAIADIFAPWKSATMSLAYYVPPAAHCFSPPLDDFDEERQHAGHVNRKSDGSYRALPPPPTTLLNSASAKKSSWEGKGKPRDEDGDDSGSDSDRQLPERNVPGYGPRKTRRSKSHSPEPHLLFFFASVAPRYVY